MVHIPAFKATWFQVEAKEEPEEEEEMENLLQSLDDWMASNPDVPQHIKAMVKAATSSDGSEQSTALPCTSGNDVLSDSSESDCKLRAI